MARSRWPRRVRVRHRPASARAATTRCCSPRPRRRPVAWCWSTESRRGRDAGRSLRARAQRYAPDVVHPDGGGAIVEFASEPWPTWTFRARTAPQSSTSVACHERGHVIAALAPARAAGPAAADGAPAALGARLSRPASREPGASTSAPRSPAPCLWRPYPGVPAISAHRRRQLRHEPEWYRDFHTRRTRARARRRRGPRLARRVDLRR